MKKTLISWILAFAFILINPFILYSQDFDSGNKTIKIADSYNYNLNYDQLNAIDDFKDKSFGLNTHWSTGNQLQMAFLSGAKWIRSGVGWADVEPEYFDLPHYNWEVADKIVVDARALGLNILWILGDTPSWASSNGNRNGIPKNKLAIERWRLFVRETAQRYKEDVHFFDIWNEPNLEDFWIGSVEEWVNLILISAWEEIKLVNPENIVTGPSLALLGSSTRIKVDDFFSRLGKLNASKYIDVISQHAYEEKPEEIISQFEDGSYNCWWIFCSKQRDSLYKIYKNTGFENHKIWLTEFGWRTDKFGEIGQAEKLVDLIKRIWRRPRFISPIIYELQDDSKFPQKWGILKPDSSPKESFHYLFQLASLNK